LPSLHLLLATDMTLTGHYSESWLGVDDKYVYMISPSPSYEQNGRSAGPGASLRFETYPLADIEEVRSVNMMGNGMLVLRTKQTEFVLCRYSNTRAKQLGQFAKIVNKLAKGEALEAEDFEDP